MRWILTLQQLDTQEHLFINKHAGKPYTTISKVWDRLRKAAGLPHLRLHDLRHQFASFLVNNGGKLYEVQQILGHLSEGDDALYQLVQQGIAGSG